MTEFIPFWIFICFYGFIISSKTKSRFTRLKFIKQHLFDVTHILWNINYALSNTGENYTVLKLPFFLAPHTLNSH